MIRMEIACFLVIAFMSVLYFSAKREKTRLHKYFSAFLIVSMCHLVFDGVTIYTVNNMDTIPAWINDGVHRLFIGTMILVFFFVYRYSALLIAEDINVKIGGWRTSMAVLIAGAFGSEFLPITYIETDAGNYSYGPTAYALYVCVAIYLFLVCYILFKYWKQINSKKKMVITLALATELFILIYQAIYPLALFSGAGIMMVNLSFYLLMENPDIFLVQQIEKEKHKADEANAAKSKFLSQTSHEIRTPMNAIVGMTEILLRTDLTEEQREYLTNIKSSGNALVSIINDILDISKIEAGKMELTEDNYELLPILDEVRMIIENRIGEKPITLLYEIDEKLPHRLYGDGLRIRQIIINLMNNAVKFTDEGHIQLKLQIESKSEEELQLYVSVADTGQGIREEDLERLFGAFEQVDVKKNKGKEGTGLGLSISSQLIQLMGGKLEVRSEYGVGSEFFFTIRQGIVSGEVEDREDADVDDMNFIAPEAKILVVDDNEMNRKVAVGLLAPLQMQIDVADSGKKAIEMIQQKKYDMVLMDHMMPVMDGVEATQLLREMEGTYYKELPIIALTANAMKDAEKLFYEVGMNGFVAKPIDMRQMCSVIRKWLHEDLIIKQEVSESDGKHSEGEDASVAVDIPDIEGIDKAEGIKNSGTVEWFVSLLGDFYKLIDAKTNKIEKCVEDGMLRDYTIEVHALKNTARMIGAMELSEEFLQLEKLGNEENLEEILKKTRPVLEHYRSYKPILKPFGEQQGVEKRAASNDEIIMYLKGMQEAVESFDLDMADEAMEQLEACQLPDECQEQLENLRVYIADVAMENILEVTEEMITILEKSWKKRKK